MVENETNIDRDAVIGRVVKSVARLRARGPLFTVFDDDGVAPILVTLPEDRVGDVKDRVIQMGGKANVIYATPEHFTIVSWLEDSIDIEVMHDIDVHEDITMGMLMAWMNSHDGATRMNLIRATRETMQPRELEYQF